MSLQTHIETNAKAKEAKEPALDIANTEHLKALPNNLKQVKGEAYRTGCIPLTAHELSTTEAQKMNIGIKHKDISDTLTQDNGANTEVWARLLYPKLKAETGQQNHDLNTSRGF